MKIFLCPAAYNIEGKSSLLNKGYPIVHTLPDTAMLHIKRPFFIPDFAEVCTVQLCLAVRVCRLGRSIGSRFAHRYYDAYTAAALFSAHPLWEELQRQGLPWDIACGFDDALAVGDFCTKVADATAVPEEAVMNVDGEPKQRIPAGTPFARIDAFIAAISNFYTLRQGDVLLFDVAGQNTQVFENNHLELNIDNRCVLSFNVK